MSLQQLAVAAIILGLINLYYALQPSDMSQYYQFWGLNLVYGGTIISALMLISKLYEVVLGIAALWGWMSVQ